MPTSRLGRFAFILGVLVALLLQYTLWVGEGGLIDHAQLRTQIQQLEHDKQQRIERNTLLTTEVNALKNGLETVEEYARLDLGLIKPGETFIQLSNIKDKVVTAPATDANGAVVDSETPPELAGTTP